MDYNDKKIGFVKYTGKLVEDGYMDAKLSALALLGVDEAIRFLSTSRPQNLRVLNSNSLLELKKALGKFL